MATSKVFTYTKENNFTQYEFGKYQSGFNFCLTIDETKDSAKILVLTKSEDILAPSTIVRLEGINAWWCVKKDTRQRHKNESGYLYEHTIELQGAFEILNSRDLINCGFNVDHYNVGQFLNRLVSLSSFKLPISFDYGTSLGSTKVVDFLKTFENYTLASAIKEFLNGYNCIPKMVFNQNAQNQITSATIKIYSKSGLADTPLNESVFNEVSAVDNIDRESYGTKVISNIQNCVGRHAVRYPKIGATYPIGDNGQITYASASQCKIKLPSKIYEIESITFYPLVVVQMYGKDANHEIVSSNQYGFITPDDLSRQFNNFKSSFINIVLNSGGNQSDISNINELWKDFVEQLHERLPTIKNGGYWDAILEQPHGDYIEIEDLGRDDMKVYLNNERYAYNNDGKDNFILSWKQGGNEIKGFELFEQAQRLVAGYDNVHIIGSGTLRFDFDNYYLFINFSSSMEASLIDNEFSIGGTDFDLPRTLFSINYIPMADIKFKTDNDLDKEDTKLYNQNGKLVDSYAVSKLVNSYCKSIRDKELVRFGTYYNFSDIPKVGARVGDYVINNVSYDVYDNDNGGFLYKCQFSLNLYSACKSTMINANTNIRDYDCPQSNNVKRIQNYRDFIELSYESNTYGNTYLDIDRIINISLDSIGINDNFVFVMSAYDTSFDNEGDNHSNYYYYHLDHISFDLSKQKKFVVDFGDNNIVGYGYAHAYKPFSLSNFFDRDKAITIPISYVNQFGEVEGLELLATDETTAENNFGNIFISENVAIPSSIYQNFESNYNLKISEESYEKDGLEIPVFEYSCEISGDDNIEVADNFFEYEESYEKFVAIKCSFPVTNENETIVSSYDKYDCDIENDSGKLRIKFTGTKPSTAIGHWGIYAKKGNKYRFLFALNDYPRNYENNEINVYINCYKLK